MSEANKFNSSIAFRFWSVVNDSYSFRSWLVWSVLNDCYSWCFIFEKWSVERNKSFNSKSSCYVKHHQKCYYISASKILISYVQIGGKWCLPYYSFSALWFSVAIVIPMIVKFVKCMHEYYVRLKFVNPQAHIFIKYAERSLFQCSYFDMLFSDRRSSFRKVLFKILYVMWCVSNGGSCDKCFIIRMCVQGVSFHLRLWLWNVWSAYMLVKCGKMLFSF